MTGKQVVVTGANGYVGSHCCAALKQAGYIVRGTIRTAQPLDVETFVTGDVGPDTDWTHALDGADVVIHTAARVHIFDETEPDSLAAFRRVNVAGTIRLAQQAAAAGVKRFLFISTVGIFGQKTPPDIPFTEKSPPHPYNPYAQSKWEAEQHLQSLNADMEIVIVRAPLVYGPGAPGNFDRLVRWVSKGVPLPLGGLNNRRSFVGIDNLVDFLVLCVEHPAAAGQTLLVTDGEDLSTTQLIQHLARAQGKNILLIPVPPHPVRWALQLLGRQRLADQLYGSLVIDSSQTRQLTGWTPPVAVAEGLRRAVTG